MKKLLTLLSLSVFAFAVAGCGHDGGDGYEDEEMEGEMMEEEMMEEEDMEEEVEEEEASEEEDSE